MNATMAPWTLSTCVAAIVAACGTTPGDTAADARATVDASADASDTGPARDRAWRYRVNITDHVDATEPQGGAVYFGAAPAVTVLSWSVEGNVNTYARLSAGCALHVDAAGDVTTTARCTAALSSGEPVTSVELVRGHAVITSQSFNASLVWRIVGAPRYGTLNGQTVTATMTQTIDGTRDTFGE